jgi:DNA polymerase-3 subunit alpha
MVASLSDRSGQFEATVFDEEPCAALEASAKAGGCGLLTVELDRRAGDETPRVTIKRFQPLEALAIRTRLQMTVRLADASIIAQLTRELGGATGGTGTLRFILPLAGGGEALVLVGRDFVLDAEIAALIQRVTGEGSVDLSVQEPPKLALVG